MEVERRCLWIFVSGFCTHVVATTVCVTGVCTHTQCRTHIFSDTFSFPGVQTSRTRMAQGVCSAHVISFHLTLSILMFHPPSLLFPHGHFETTFLSARSLTDFTRSESGPSALPHERWGVCGYLADPTHSRGYEPKEFKKITSADGDTTPDQRSELR